MHILFWSDMKKLIAEHAAKLAELDAKLAHIEWLEQQIMELDNPLDCWIAASLDWQDPKS
jgi:hypothetical protein